VLGGRLPTLSDLTKLEYTTRVVQEALRLYPPAWTIARQAIKPDVIHGVPVAPRTVVLMSPYVVHRNPSFWDDPELFDPDRFLPERAAGRPQLSYFPFGAGPRVCIGMSFAMMEAKIVTAMLIQRFRFSLAPGFVAEPDPLITMKPKHGIDMTLHHVRSGVGPGRPLDRAPSGSPPSGQNPPAHPAQE
jgi:cytochrome P450